jgi:protein gp37
VSKTSIEWTRDDQGNPGHTWNPVLGCSKISPGCKNCYAINHVHRMAHNPNPTIKAANEGLTIIEGGHPNWTGKVRLIPERLDVPLKKRKPTRYFVNSLSDLFHESLPEESIDLVFAAMANAHWHTYQVLTKRAARMLQYFSERNSHLEMTRCFRNFRDYADPVGPWPLPNVHLGVSVESREYLSRIDHLRKAPAAVRFLSLEPLLEDLGQLDLSGIHWVIVGAESGRGARRVDLEWVRSIVRQCRDAEVACFVKQLGKHPYDEAIGAFGDGAQEITLSGKGGDMQEWPGRLRVREFPVLQKGAGS